MVCRDARETRYLVKMLNVENAEAERVLHLMATRARFRAETTQHLSANVTHQGFTPTLSAMI